MSSILSSITGLSFAVKRPLVRKWNCFYSTIQNLLLENPFGAKRCLLKNSVVAINYCDCFQAFVEGEKFLVKDADKFIEQLEFGKTLFLVVCRT
jgi:hypothetical protein